MTEAEWLACDDPLKLLKRARFRSSRRKTRLFAVACCRRVWPLLIEETSRRAVEVAERYADGAASDKELRGAASAAHGVHHAMVHAVGKGGACIEWAAAYAAHSNPFHAAKNVSWMAATPRFYEVRRVSRPPSHGEGDPDDLRLIPCTVTRRSGFLSTMLRRWDVVTLKEVVPTGPEKPVQVALIRCIFGNPFRPGALDPAWLSASVVSLTQAAYDERQLPTGTLDPARLAVLADALEEAGCMEEAILSHLRAPGPHVRGCWVVDRILGKE